MNHNDALEYFDGNRRRPEARRMSVGRRVEDSRDALKVKAFDEIVQLLTDCPEADDEATIDSILFILKGHGAQISE